MEPVLIAVITMLGGSGGIAVVWRAILDHKERKASRESDLSERLSSRLESRLDIAEQQREEAEEELEAERDFTLALCVLLARNGIDIPERPTKND